jgi:N-acetylgalactosamine-N,N'-diacetylbacillosaminyl-diphospho-undecaprenol 4-alpha-N-acetylgalactosaminyltransferase
LIKISEIEDDENHMVFLINSMGEGGAQGILLSLVDEYLLQDIKITVIFLAKNHFYELPNKVNKIYLHKKDDELSAFYETLLIPYYAWKLKIYVKKENLKIVQSHLFRANFVNIISKLFSSKHLVQVVNHSVISRFFNEGFSGKINLFLINFLYPKADKIIYISKRMKEDFLMHVKGIENKGDIIYNPYNITKVLEGVSKKNDNFIFNPSKKYLITIGRLISLKRFEDVLLALSALDNDIELIMLGDGEKKVKLMSLTEELNITSRVHFLGQVKNPFFYLSRADLMIAPSSVEGFPNVLVESMICRTAVISTDCMSGPREILAPNSNHAFQLKEGIEMAEFGILYVVGDVAGLTQSIGLLLKDNKLREAYEEKAFEQSKTLSVSKIANIYKETFFR